MVKSHFSQAKQGHKLSRVEAITFSPDTATHFSQSNSRRNLQSWSYRLLMRLAALLTQASLAVPNWFGRFSGGLSKPHEPSDARYSARWNQQAMPLWANLLASQRSLPHACDLWIRAKAKADCFADVLLWLFVGCTDFIFELFCKIDANNHYPECYRPADSKMGSLYSQFVVVQN